MSRQPRTLNLSLPRNAVPGSRRARAGGAAPTLAPHHDEVRTVTRMLWAAALGLALVAQGVHAQEKRGRGLVGALLGAGAVAAGAKAAAKTQSYALGFAVVFIGSVLLGGLVAVLARKLFAAIGLRPVDRALGAGFGLVRGLVLLLAATVVIGMTPMKSSEWWRESVSAGVLTTSLKGLKPLLPEESGKYLP